MIAFFNQLRWQFILLQKNNIISISLGVTFFYGAVLYLVKDFDYMDKVLTTVALNDPATIGLIFIGLIISTEKKNGTLAAVFVSPLNPHVYLITKILALSILGTLCALMLAFFVLGFSFHIFQFTVGVLSVCLLSAILGIIIISYTFEFLKFALYSIPVLLGFINLALLDYLNAIELGFFKFLLPGQAGLSLISNAYLETANSNEVIYGYLATVLWTLILYVFAFRIFKSKVINI